MNEMTDLDTSYHKIWACYIECFAKWTSFWTLTFSEADRTHEVTRTECEFLWRRLVQCLNDDLYGHHYTRIVGHSYFGYALAFEYQTRGALHMHALIDGATNWELANRVWRNMAGIIKIKPVDDAGRAARYISKYVTKGGDIVLYRQGKWKQPSFIPAWLQDATRKLEVHRAE